MKPPEPRTSPQDDLERDARSLLASGAAVGAIGVIGAVLGGAVCPVCVVATPALLGAGAYKKWRAARARRADAPVTDAPPTARAIR